MGLIKTYGPGYTLVVRKACHFVTKYRAVLEATLHVVITDPADLAVALAGINTIINLCNTLEKYYPPEAS